MEMGKALVNGSETTRPADYGMRRLVLWRCCLKGQRVNPLTSPQGTMKRRTLTGASV